MAKSGSNGHSNGQATGDVLGGDSAVATPPRELDLGSDDPSPGLGTARDGGRKPRPREHNPGVDELERLSALVAEFGGSDARQVQTDVDAMENWPMLWSCLTCCKTTSGSDRCPGEVRIEAQGSLWTVSLIMPEEERQIRCCAEMLSGALDALEGALCSRPVPWVPCSKYAAKKRRTPKKKTS
jgi:hypothetical protein